MSYKNVENLKYYVKLSFSSYKRPTPFETKPPVTEKYLLLPLPLELRDDTAVNYTNENLQLSGDILNGDVASGVASQALRRSGDLISKGLSGTIGGLVNMIPGAEGLAEGVGNEVQEAFPASQVASALSQTLGVAPNPNPSVAFQGPQLRELNMSWTLTPTTKEDSRRIRNTINYLKRSALPSNSISSSAAILDYPKLVQVNFYPWDRGGSGSHGWSDRSIIKMKRCFMSAVNVNYTPSNTPAFFHGTNEPVAVQLSISLKEVEYFLSSDYGGNTGGNKDEVLGRITANTATLTSQISGVTQPEGDQGTAPEAQAAPS
jgi:hypothetical protein